MTYMPRVRQEEHSTLQTLVQELERLEATRFDDVPSCAGAKRYPQAHDSASDASRNWQRGHDLVWDETLAMLLDCYSVNGRGR